MRRIPLVTLLLAAVLYAAPAMASSPHYVNGLAGIKAATLGPPGKYWVMYNFFYNADAINDNDGKKMDVDYDMSVYMLVNRFMYSSDFKIFGARYAIDIMLPLVHTHVEASKDVSFTLPNHFSVTNLTLSARDSKTGFSDILFEPLMLTWEGAQYDISAGLGIFIPTGDYDPKQPASPGRGFWTFKPGLGATVYFDKERTWSASILAHYEFHTKQRKTDTTPGEHFHFEWGLGKTLFKIMEVGIAGYNSWQVTDDKGGNARSGHSTAHAVGPEIGITIPQLRLILNLRSLWEFENRNNARGNTTNLTLTYAF